MGYLADDSYCGFYVTGEDLDLPGLREDWEGVRSAGARFVVLSFSSPAELEFLGDEDAWATVTERFPEAIRLFVNDQNLAYQHAVRGDVVRTIEFSEGRWTKWMGSAEPWEVAAGASTDRTDFDPRRAGILVGRHFGFEPCPSQ